MMITLLEKYETQCKLLKVRFYPCYIPTNRSMVITDFLKIVGPRGQNFIGSGISVVLVGPTVRLTFQFRLG
jgi:hypothetical protein